MPFLRACLRSQWTSDAGHITIGRLWTVQVVECTYIESSCNVDHMFMCILVLQCYINCLYYVHSL